MKKILLVLLLGFMSCDMFTYYSLSLDNQTEDTVEIVFSEGSPYSGISPDRLIFPPGTKNIFYRAPGRQTQNPCSTIGGMMEGTVEVHTSSGRKVQKEICNINNWSCAGSNKKGWEKTFVITEDDLE